MYTKQNRFQEIKNSIWFILNHILPTKPLLSLRYRVVFGKWIDWNNPKAFTEKLQWLKVYGYKPEYTKMVDKILAKEYVERIIGREYIIPTLETWHNPQEIDISNLPDKFVLKCNHDSGTYVLCHDKTVFDLQQAKTKLIKAFRMNYYYTGREKPYKGVKRAVFAEQFLDHNGDLVDYKFFCFGGEPKVLKIDYDRGTKHHANYYTIDMELLPFFKKSSKPDTPKVFLKPTNYDKMVSIARVLSKGLPFVRIDLYNIEGKIYFGEMTFFPSSGFEPLTDVEWDKKLGSWITLPNKS